MQEVVALGQAFLPVPLFPLFSVMPPALHTFNLSPAEHKVAFCAHHEGCVEVWKAEVKLILEQVMEAQRGRRGIALLFL